MVARIGAHVTAEPGPWGFDNQVQQLNDMDADTCRIQMFTGATDDDRGVGNGKRFSEPQMDQLFAATNGPEIIIQSSELVRVTGNTMNFNGIEYQFNQVKYYARRYPNRHVTFEIGNEPNEPMGRPITVEGKWAESPEAARERIKQCYQHCAAGKPSNVWLAVNNVSGRGYHGEEFYNRFSEPDASGWSPVHTPQIVTLHAYVSGGNALCLNAQEDPLVVLRWVRSWNVDKPVKITEAGIHQPAGDRPEYGGSNRARSYVEFADKLQRFSNELGGQPWAYCDSVCFYYVGYDDSPGGLDFRINEQDTGIIRSRYAGVNYCG